MRGKRAKELRRVAQALAGADAPAIGYAVVQQRDGSGQPCRPRTLVIPGTTPDANGVQRVFMQVIRQTVRSAATKWRKVTTAVTTDVPVLLTTGRGVILHPGCTRNLYKRLKGHLRTARQSSARKHPAIVRRNADS